MPRMKVRRDEFASEYLAREIHDTVDGTFVAWHRRMNIGKVNYPHHEEFLESLPEGSLTIPIFIYDHGDFVLSVEPFGCPWDSGQVGVWVFTPEELLIFGQSDEAKSSAMAIESARGSIAYMNDIHSCNVWSFEIEDFDGEVADFVGGFVGDDAVDQMKHCVPKNLHNDLMDAWEHRFE